MRRLVGFVAIAALVASTAACPKQKDKSPDGDGKITAARRGGTLRLGISTMSNLDPAQARSVEQQQVADMLYDGLTAYDPKTLEPVAALADRWEATADQKAWVFHLRPNATFAGGQAITSADVKASIERLVRKGDGAPKANGDLLESVAGYLPFATGGAVELSGVTTPAPDLVRFDLDAPVSTLASILANPGFGVIAKDQVDKAIGLPQDVTGPLGSGPFEFTGETAGVVSLTRRPDSTAFVDKVELRQFDDVARAYAAFREGEVDWSRVPPDKVAQAGEEYGRRHYTAYLAELFFGFNLKSPAFANPKFRAAILAAVNHKSIVQAVYDSTVEDLEGIVVPQLRAGSEDLCAGACGYDPAKAKQLLAEAFGAGAPPDVQIDYDKDSTYDAVAKAIQDNLRTVGIPATPRPRNLPEYQKFVLTDEKQLFRFGWIAAYPSPDAFLYPLFFSGSGSNLVGLASGPIDDQLRTARSSSDPSVRTAAWTAAERAILAETPVLPLAQFQIHAVVSKRVNGLKTLSTGTFDATTLSIVSN